MAKSFDTTEDFLGHSTRSKNTKFLNWKEDGELTCWLHTKQLPFAIWTHGFPKVHIKKDTSGDEERKVVFGKYNCHEEEDVLKNQYFRNKDGSRKMPPTKCGFCKFIEWMRGQVVSGAVPWTKPIFRFDHEDPTKTIIVHAAGIYNGFKGEMTKEQKDDLREHGVSPKKAWGENALAKCEYVFTLVDEKHPENGVQVSNETGLLGDKVKDVIVDRRESLGAEKGDPFLNPVAIKFVYKADEENPQAKYKARALEGIVLTPLVRELITSEPPDLERQIAPFNAKECRTFLETHCLLKNVPWDDLFNVGGDDDADGDHGHKHTPAGPDAEEHDAAEPDDDDLVACDKCEKPMKATDTVCAHCGAKYEVEQQEPEPPKPVEKPPIRKRSELAKPGEKKGGGKMPF